MSETIGEIKGRYPALVELTQGEGDLAKRARIELLTLWGVFDKPMEVHTMTECAYCKRGVRPRYAIHGLCAECARGEIARLREEHGLWRKTERRLYAEKRALLEAVEELRQDATNLIGAAKDAEREIKRLRGIERVLLEVFGPETPRQQAINFWYDFSDDDVGTLMNGVRDAIADALKADA